MIRNLFYGLLFASLSSVQAASLFNFDSTTPGTYTAFTDVNNGIFATFSSNGDPGGFEVIPSFFGSLSGNVLLDPGPALQDRLALTVTFSHALRGISLDFAINTFFPTDAFNLSAYAADTLVGSGSFSGSIPNGLLYPEGTATFSGAGFDKVVFSSIGRDFAVDNISIVGTPEPRSLSAVGLVALFGVTTLYRRRRTAFRA